jgi:hypothetical protein
MRWPRNTKRRDILKDVVADLQRPTTWAALSPEAAVINPRGCGSFSPA